MPETPPVTPTNNIFVIGDSLSVGDDLEVEGWVGHLASAMQAATGDVWMEKPLRYAVGSNTVKRTIEVINAQLATRYDVPDYTLILLGTNDPWEEGYSETTFKADYRTLIAALRSKWATTPIYLGKSYRNGSEATMATVNGYIDDLIAEHTDYLFNGFDLGDVFAGNVETYTYDGLHPSHAGALAMADEWVTILTA